MRRIARLFSALALLALIGAAAFLWVRPPPPPPSDLPPLSGPVDLIRIEKAARRMSLVQDDKVVRTYSIALGFAPEGDKQREGDGRTPEGTFRIDRRNDRSSYHLSLGLDYPHPDDIARARAGNYSPGGDIMIHGQPNSLPDGLVLKGDWTAGCIAVSDAEMQEIWNHVEIGTMVVVNP